MTFEVILQLMTSVVSIHKSFGKIRSYTSCDLVTLLRPYFIKLKIYVLMMLAFMYIFLINKYAMKNLAKTLESQNHIWLLVRSRKTCVPNKQISENFQFQVESSFHIWIFG